MNTHIKTITITAVFSLFIISSCKKESGKDATNPAINTPQEQITTVLLTGYNNDNPGDLSHQFSVKWEDLDGNGGNAPSIDSLLLDTGMHYHVSIVLLDKTKTPVDTISQEVEELKNIHQFFYTPSALLAGKLDVEIVDYDDNTPALPVGLIALFKTNTSSSFTLPVEGNLTIILSHYDGIPKTTAPSPESDVDITIPVRLK